MTADDISPSEPIVSDDEDVGAARYLVGLITALQRQAALQGHPEIATALTDALDAAHAIADGRSPDDPEP